MAFLFSIAREVGDSGAGVQPFPRSTSGLLCSCPTQCTARVENRWNA
ncbi:hypothetical protein KC19_7G050900 [Ceratodon purpureus]|uniref:Uncharacterized protein n=1 Tax=Ceratodon purpureus TaxID=3225 RepID=A0A8T0H6C7_CERPU|nr:hypothetical protein KC19_7G050900 [Ceratodon purpureus]